MQDQRRERLISAMQKVWESGASCAGCSGVCCTFRHNSMMVSPKEAKRIRDYLVSQGTWESEVSKLRECITEFRLDFEPPGMGKKTLRKNYTCPFFNGGELGCRLPFDIKPLGCLAFNPTPAGEQGRDCKSDSELLKEIGHDEGEYLSIPKALLNLGM